MHFKNLVPLVAAASAAIVRRQTCPMATEAELAAARNVFVVEEVDPDVVQNFDPKTTLDVSYPEGPVTLGNEFNLLRKSYPND